MRLGHSDLLDVVQLCADEGVVTLLDDCVQVLGFDDLLKLLTRVSQSLRCVGQQRGCEPVSGGEYYFRLISSLSPCRLT